MSTEPFEIKSVNVVRIGNEFNRYSIYKLMLEYFCSRNRIAVSHTFIRKPTDARQNLDNSFYLFDEPFANALAYTRLT